MPDLELPEVDPHELFSSTTLEEGDRFRAGGRAFWAGEQALQLAVLSLLAWRGRALTRRLEGRIPRAALLGVATGVVCVITVWFVQLPLGAGRHAWRWDFEVTRQGSGAWLVDRALSLLVLAILVGVAAGVFVELARRFGPSWWVPGGALLAVCGLVFALLQPLVIQPLFNDFRELREPALVADITAIADELGVTIGGVEVRDQSRRTSVANARVTGIGPSTRVVIDDTLLDGDAFRRAEVRGRGRSRARACRTGSRLEGSRLVRPVRDSGSRDRRVRDEAGGPERPRQPGPRTPGASYRRCRATGDGAASDGDLAAPRGRGRLAGAHDDP